jgi:hypothetical protein
MNYVNNGMTYWTKEAMLNDTTITLDGPRSLMLNVQPMGQVQYIRLDKTAFAPKTLTLPRMTTLVIENGGEALDTEFSAALSGLLIAPKTGPRG